MIVPHPSLPLALAALVALPTAVLAPKALAPLFALAAVSALAIHVYTHRAFPPVPRRLGGALAALLIVAAASALWSLTPDRTLGASASLAGLTLGIAVLLGIAQRLDQPARARIGAALLLGVVAGTAALLIDRVFDRVLLRAGLSALGWDGGASPYTLKPAATVLALMIWPCLLVLSRRESRVASMAAGSVLVAAIMFSGSIAASLGAILGLGAFWLARSWPRVAGPLLGAVLAGFMIAAPWLPSLLPDPRVSMAGIDHLPNSAVHRIVIWQTTASRIHERPWLGHGFDTSRSLYPQSTSAEVRFARPTIGKSEGVNAEPIPLHPHNMALQVWLEMGALGAGAALAVLLSVLAALARAPLGAAERAAGYGFFVAALAIAATAYGAWQSWWLSALGLNAAFLVAVFSRAPKTP